MPVLLLLKISRFISKQYVNLIISEKIHSLQISNIKNIVYYKDKFHIVLNFTPNFDFVFGIIKCFWNILSQTRELMSIKNDAYLHLYKYIEIYISPSLQTIKRFMCKNYAWIKYIKISCILWNTNLVLPGIGLVYAHCTCLISNRVLFSLS